MYQTLEVSGNGGHTSGDKTFKTAPLSGNAVLLDFDVAGQSVALRRNGEDYFTGTMPTAPGSTDGIRDCSSNHAMNCFTCYCYGSSVPEYA